MWGNGIGNISSNFLKNQDSGRKDSNQDSQGGDDEDENDQNEKEEEVDKTKSTGTYQYESLTEELHAYEISNFKVNDLQPYGKGRLTIEKIKESGQHLVIFRNPAKLILFQGILIKGLSNSGFMKGKDDAIFIISYCMEKGEEEGAKAKPVRKNCKMALLTAEDAKKLTTYVPFDFSQAERL